MAEYRKKLIEVVLPLEALSVACKSDKDRKTGHIRNLHKWFAPMPLPALRAIIYATLVDAPSNAKEQQVMLDELTSLLDSGPLPPPKHVMDNARRRITASIGSLDDIVVFDPFCGGGSTLLEAQRFGVNVAGSDLNPIPVLITQSLTSLTQSIRNSQPLHAEESLVTGVDNGVDGFLKDVMYYAKLIRERAWTRLAPFYPAAPDGNPIVAWWWANSVPSPDPSMLGAHTPLVSSWQLSKQKGRHLYVKPHVDKEKGSISFTIEVGDSTIDPSIKRCLFSPTSIPLPYIREKGQQKELGTMMLACVSAGPSGREYFTPDNIQLSAANSATPVEPPDLPIDSGGLGISVTNYGVSTWDDVFTPRQQLCLETFAEEVANVPQLVRDDGGSDKYGKAIATILGLCLGKLSMACSKNVRWRIRSGPVPKAEAAFSRADLPFLWDFAETNPFGGSVGDWMQVVQTSLRAFDLIAASGRPATVVQADARKATSNSASRLVIITDPPYFDAIGYASLSEYFYVWIRKALRNVHSELLRTLGVPKTDELIASPSRHGSSKEASEYFVSGFTETFEHLGGIADPEFPIVIVYAKKQEEKKGESSSTGWEAMLEAIFAGGLGISGTWPIRGTGSTRMRAQSSNALASYTVLVCRPRTSQQPQASRRKFLELLRNELPKALNQLQQGSIAPVDLAQAAIGPGMAVFSRFSKVVESDGSSMSVRKALSIINQVLDEVLSLQEGEFDSDTRWAVSWFEQFGNEEGDFGVADALSRAKNTAVNGLVDAGIISARGGRVRLVSRDELDIAWDPVTDKRLTAWEVTQHLIRTLETEGETAAARLVLKLGGVGETARELAYRLYSICERKKWSDEALAYNGLVIAWPELFKLALAERSRPQESQQDLFTTSE